MQYFFCKALVLKNEIEEKLDLEITSRQIDNFLINEANGLLRNNSQLIETGLRRAK